MNRNLLLITAGDNFMKKFVVRITPKKKYALVEFDSGYEKLPHEAVQEMMAAMRPYCKGCISGGPTLVWAYNAYLTPELDELPEKLLRIATRYYLKR